VVGDSTRMLERNLLSFGFDEVQTAQEQPIIGIPVLVPVPRKVIFKVGEATAQI